MNDEAAQVPALAFPPFTGARRVRAELLAGILRSGRSVPDEAFDEIYPEPVRSLSSVHWSPVRVCARAVELLALRPGARLLDVGAGVGKFCIIAAAMSGTQVVGIERRPELAEVAREAARRLGIAVEIVSGSFDAYLPSCDAAYFFNPFREAVLLPGVASAIPSAAAVTSDIAAAEKFLEAAAIGMRVVFFYGFGGSVPRGYERLAQETLAGGALELWEKRTLPQTTRGAREV